MSKLAKALTAAAGNAGESLYVEDVFSTYLYEGGNGSGTNQAVNVVNDVNLNEEGGLIWLKRRDVGNSHALIDTERGRTQWLNTDTTSAAISATGIDSFNTDGFTVSSTGYGETNNTSGTYASWTFRKAEKFFDVVTYTGDGVAGREIAHNLGSVPACIVVKRTDSTSPWIVYHSSIGNNKILQLEATLAAQTFAHWYNTNPTSSVFTVNSFNAMNASGGSYVAYLFASDAGGFGDDGSESIIKCGSYTGTGAAGLEVDLGFEPQWVLIKHASGGSIQVLNWVLEDNMRGATDSGSATLFPNKTDDEETQNGWYPTPTGFKVGNYLHTNQSGSTYIYIAIRRPMKTPESGTEVFAPTAYSGTEPTPQYFSTGFTVDFNLYKYRTLSIGTSAWDRLRGGDKYLVTSSTGAEADISGNSSAQILAQQFERNDGFSVGTGGANAGSVIAYSFKRATGFFDVVAYSGSSTLFQTYNHNLGVEPEMYIVKCRNSGTDGDSPADWYVAVKGAAASGVGSGYVFSGGLNKTDAVLDDSTWGGLSSTTFTPWYAALKSGPAGLVCQIPGNKYIAYLFATLAGVSKVGSYTGTGSNVDVDCGFSTGARFILIKRTDSTGDWYVWDSARGISAGDDPWYRMNSNVGEVTNTDYIDPLASGFTVTSSAPAALNASGGNYIFLAIA